MKIYLVSFAEAGSVRALKKESAPILISYHFFRQQKSFTPKTVQQLETVQKIDTGVPHLSFYSEDISQINPGEDDASE